MDAVLVVYFASRESDAIDIGDPSGGYFGDLRMVFWGTVAGDHTGIGEEEST
jgi:hypothetical protein